MEYRPLGRSGLEASTLCLGSMTFGEQNSEDDAHAQLDRAWPPVSILSTRRRCIRFLPRADRVNIETALDSSLQRLGTDYIDIYQPYWPERETDTRALSPDR